LDSSIIEMDSADELRERLKRYCLALTNNLWDAEDLVQDTLVKAFSARKGPQHANSQAVLLRIAKNTWIDHTRRQKLQLRYIEQEKRRIDYSYEQGIGNVELIFQALMKHMTPLQRAVFLLKDVYDYSIKEIALLLNTSQGAVKAALHRARYERNNVKRDIEGHEFISTRDESFKSLLHSLAIAYQVGDVTRVLALAMSGEVEATSALAIAHNQVRRATTSAKEGSLQLCA
jgi:RNA polymerase sigma factor (sigma-70 family)